MPLSDDDWRDIQGLVRFGYGHLTAARFHLLTIADAAAARSWLSNAPVTTAVKGHRPDVALQIAFTYEGLQRLGVASSTLAQFPYEFISGMTEASRARRLGDVAANDRQWWLWGGPGKLPHVLMLLYAVTPDRLDQWERELKNERWKAGFSTLTCLTTKDIGDIEPFGFNDGISQPVIDWERKKSARVHDTTAYTNLSALGEILLGYPNEYGKYTDRPLLDPRDDTEGILPSAEDVPGKKDLGRNGTYLVLRDLSQDAPAFWQFINDQAASHREETWLPLPWSVACRWTSPSFRATKTSFPTTSRSTPCLRARRSCRLAAMRFPVLAPIPRTSSAISSPFTTMWTARPVPMAPISAAPIHGTPISRKAPGACLHG
jgi:hypothetical protein